MAEQKITTATRELVEKELRRGTSKSRIASLIGVSYEEASQIIMEISEDFRPDVGVVIRFTFRDELMQGTIIKLLTNSAVVEIDWDNSSQVMKDICNQRTIVNFKDFTDNSY